MTYKAFIKGAAATGLAIALVAACTTSPAGQSDMSMAQLNTGPGKITPENWPQATTIFDEDPVIEARIADLLSKMSLEEKVGQVVQADIGSVTPDEAREYNLGSVLNGGNSAPGGDNRAPAQEWLELADAFWEASTDTSDGGLGIPALWGTDAVHGHNNIVGATVFPHNIGLGAANDPDMMERIGAITTREMRVTGQDWTFAPTIAVARNDRWGRTYESYSEDPELVARYAPRLVVGIQGDPAGDTFLKGEKMIATTKHFVGDGGTTDGTDQGEMEGTEAQLRDIHAAGYPPAIAAGVQVVMASYNTFHGRKMHGHKEMLTDVLRDRMAFDGFVVGDWNGHGQIQGCTNTDCPESLNAGLDMYMAPDSWKDLYTNTLASVRSGEITMERLDEAVSRILRVKLRAGLFEAGRPSTRPLAGDYDVLGSAEHMLLAREAVRKSLVLLKNDGVLPIQPGAKIVVAGDGANDIGKQSGGWTLSWQGTGNTREDFPKGASIFEGLSRAANAAGGSAVLSVDGKGGRDADVAIVVFGENPYAEFQGDKPHVDYDPEDGLRILEGYKAAGIPTVAVFLSGRPLWVNPEINASDAFVAAWLPGTAGEGVADVLLANADGSIAHDFKGRLSFSWPKSAMDAELNVGDSDYDPLFAYGYGLSYGEPGVVATLPTDASLTAAGAAIKGNFLIAGVPPAPGKILVSDAGGQTILADTVGRSTNGAVTVVSADRDAQEDIRIVRWAGPGSYEVSSGADDFSRESNGEMAIRVTYKVNAVGDGPVEVFMVDGEYETGALDMTDGFTSRVGQDWQTSVIRLSCFMEQGVDMQRLTSPFGISAGAGTEVHINEVRLQANDDGQANCAL